MSRTVTAGIDGSSESLAAAHWAAREAEHRRLPLRLVHAWAPNRMATPIVAGPEEPPPGSHGLPERTAAELRRDHPDLEITAERVTGDPGSVLPVLAGESELLALGTRGRSGIAGFILGSVALATVARTEHPVALIRAGERAEDEHRHAVDGQPTSATGYLDVVVGIDLDHPNDELLEFAFDAAARRSAVLRVVHAWEAPPLFSYDPELTARELAERKAGQAQALADALRPWRGKFPDVEVAERSVHGRPARQLLFVSTSASLIVVGKRIRRTLIGSRIGPVTHALLHHATAPVVVVPHE